MLDQLDVDDTHNPKSAILTDVENLCNCIKIYSELIDTTFKEEFQNQTKKLDRRHYLKNTGLSK